MIEVFDDDFDGILIDADIKYQEKKKLYGLSWKDMSEEQLRRRFLVEVEELEEAETSMAKYSEAIDVINVALMLAHRLIHDGVDR